MFPSPAVVFTLSHSAAVTWREDRSAGKHVHRLTRMEILFLVCLTSTPPQLSCRLISTLTCKCIANIAAVTCKELWQKKNSRELQERRSEQLTANQFQLSIKASVLIYLLSANWDVCDLLALSDYLRQQMPLNGGRCPCLFWIWLWEGTGCRVWLSKCLGMLKRVLLPLCTSVY